MNILVVKSELLYHIHSTLMMACCGSIKSLSYLRTPLCMYTKYIPMQITQMSIFTLQKTYRSYTKSLHYMNLTNLRFKKRSFIPLSLAQVKSCVSKFSMYIHNSTIIRTFSIDPKVGVNARTLCRPKHSLNHFSLSDRVSNK